MLKQICGLTFALMLMPVSTLAIEWPVNVSEAKAFGESMSPMQVVQHDLQLNGSTPTSPHGSISTPFGFQAFVYSTLHAKYQDPSPANLAEIKQHTYLSIRVFAFSTILGTNNEMVVVIKQNGRIIHAFKNDKPDEDVTDYPRVGYRTTQGFSFQMADFDTQAPFTVAVANAVVDGGVATGETDWQVDPSTLK